MICLCSRIPTKTFHLGGDTSQCRVHWEDAVTWCHGSWKSSDGTVVLSHLLALPLQRPWSEKMQMHLKIKMVHFPATSVFDLPHFKKITANDFLRHEIPYLWGPCKRFFSPGFDWKKWPAPSVGHSNAAFKRVGNFFMLRLSTVVQASPPSLPRTKSLKGWVMDSK